MTNIILADNYPLIAEGIKCLSKAHGMQLVEVVSSMEELLDKLEQRQADIILLEIAMQEENGMESLKQLKKIYPDIPVLVLSKYPEERYAIRAFKIGAHGYLNKSVCTQEFIKAIKTIVNEGRRYITEKVAEVLVEELNFEQDKVNPLHQILSNREEQILLLIARGYKVSEIAQKLHLSTHTIHTYRSRILKKLNIKSNSDITHYALTHDLIN